MNNTKPFELEDTDPALLEYLSRNFRKSEPILISEIHCDGMSQNMIRQQLQSR